MRNTVAKRLRAKARATSTPTQQKITRFKRWMFIGRQRVLADLMDTVRNTGYRKVYQDLKKEYARKRRA